MASEMQHFKSYSSVSGNIRVDISFDRFSKQFEQAQWWLGEQVLQSCRAHMPLRTGNLQQLSHTEDGGRRVVFPGPYGRFQYMGKVMVGEETGSPWARKGERKVVTDRPLTYSRAEATDYWFDAAKAADGEAWIQGVKKIAGGG